MERPSERGSFANRRAIDVPGQAHGDYSYADSEWDCEAVMARKELTQQRPSRTIERFVGRRTQRTSGLKKTGRHDARYRTRRRGDPMIWQAKWAKFHLPPNAAVRRPRADVSRSAATAARRHRAAARHLRT